jgi:PadR family transcriptional regulator, regulatory protein AphA
MASGQRMSTTTYAVLGLLAIKPWTTHELVHQVQLSLRRFWPRTESKLYEEPKKLVVLGYATARDEWVGRRRRVRYTITEDGRTALARWLSRPGEGPTLEFEQLLKIHFADSGSKADVLANLAAALDWVRAENAENVTVARAYLVGAGNFPERAPLNFLTGRFLIDFYAMVANWAEWARGVVGTWPDDPRDAEIDLPAWRAHVRAAERLAERMGQPVDEPEPPAAR